MIRRVIIRLLALSLIMLTMGIIAGWWLHEKLERDRESGSHGSQDITGLDSEPASGYSGFFDLDFKLEQDKTQPSGDTEGFIQALNEDRIDDALIIFQDIERRKPIQLKALRESLEQWFNKQDDAHAVRVLVRFTQYYYQDEKLLNRLAILYEKQDKLDFAIETLLDSRDFSFKDDDLKTINSRIHNLSKELYQRHFKNDQLAALGTLFQRLSSLEPEFAFYRFALSQIYITLGDIESAIYELEILQLDPEFGRRATQSLATLQLPPAPDEPEELPAGNVPLIARNGHYIVRVSAGTRESIPLLIDTGASLTTLPSELLQRLRREKLAARVGHTQLKTAGGMQFAPIYQVKELHIGNFIIRDLQVAELDLLDNDSQGLLGMDVLGQFRFQLDQDRSILFLQQRW